MQGPRPPGYSPSVTGVRPPGERPGLPRPGEVSHGPIALYGTVHRYGPRQARKTYLLRALLGLRMPDVECVWEGPRREVPAVTTPGWDDEHMRVIGICMREAEAKAALLNELDPEAIGL